MIRLEEDPQEKEPAASAHPLAMVEKSLFESRTVLVFGEVTTELAQATAARLLSLAQQSNEPIRMIVHSQGGHVEAGATIYDLVRFIGPEVKMIGTGWVASAGALIYSAAKKENRFSLPNTRFLLHQPLGGIRGNAADIEIETNQILAIRERLNRIFAEATGQPYEKIAADTDRNFWMTAAQARDYGLVHAIVERASEV
ncbi:MAG: ATP-dependent Clp protease proteolytic subunit [Polyangiaceae bacterium]|nr:ATP-dependent Clp protease proteolytic subunit [Polyangiaceae bacterium]